ncbi:alpha-(1,3)-fucosyltransferase 11-like isoform X3 [Biomphalaria glabrata]|nr:alpha-(1,3)-fucosyltransferase 11-like isoform X3 [Biomphalaria glabrata]XP_055900589.1 alpha-(1,3)-fucosyltransferase 11-like isoform X3 [Biomphalaria glabrata]XP_055900590.1 alpha-(1,3)-fucosyltransferase 11-like isoform X3 [Biomphalaria glabrata]XP_055900591.1 alpha-(1,3)-fucosyltransferase 11-like isoform X3 [Biomphalaria glabrata]XP_055900592.1 alpha-(1,3)-fucosyltransferase 11-like isoform X3 [Biomphalaria glabrata]XP_055900593.1 alpha-(1,3)-fucosyltransferase 11-like isoform X3 [Biom
MEKLPIKIRHHRTCFAITISLMTFGPFLWFAMFSPNTRVHRLDENQKTDEMTLSCNNKSDFKAVRRKPSILVKYDQIQTMNEIRGLRGNFVLSKSLGTYLTPLTKALTDMTAFNDSISEYILRSGLGLESYTTEEKVDIWTENGIQYRPFPYLEKADNPFYTSDFEAYVPFNRLLFFERDEDKALRDVQQKKIILWWQHKIAQAPIDGLQPLRACPDFPCVVTSERNYTATSSAMLINAQFVNGESPPQRRADQVLIHYQIEAPIDYWFYGDLFATDNGWNGIFNWTMSYRMDADITTYHGVVRRRRAVRRRNYREILAKKTGVVAWMVSNCETSSRRENYIAELQKYLQVDVYGKCGKHKCPRICDRQCLQDINKKYKFYIGFESSFCRDYITEKLYRYFDTDMIVIAQGHDTYSRLLPSEIFINTANFKSPKELAEMILYLDSHDEDYIAMLKEKDKYVSLYEDYPLLRDDNEWIEYRYEAVPMCELCRRLWNLKNYEKVYNDMSAWFYKKEYQCLTPNDIDNMSSTWLHHLPICCQRSKKLRALILSRRQRFSRWRFKFSSVICFAALYWMSTCSCQKSVVRLLIYVECTERPSIISGR